MHHFFKHVPSHLSWTQVFLQGLLDLHVSFKCQFMSDDITFPGLSSSYILHVRYIKHVSHNCCCLLQLPTNSLGLSSLASLVHGLHGLTLVWQYKLSAKPAWQFGCTCHSQLCCRACADSTELLPMYAAFMKALLKYLLPPYLHVACRGFVLFQTFPCLKSPHSDCASGLGLMSQRSSWVGVLAKLA